MTREEMHAFRAAIGTIKMATEVLTPILGPESGLYLQIIDHNADKILDLLRDAAPELRV